MSNLIIQIHPEDVKSVKWSGHYQSYDVALHALNQGRYEKFLVVNPVIDDLYKTGDNPVYYIDEDIPNTDKCIFWTYKQNWVAKLFTKNWTPADEYLVVPLSPPESKWSKNRGVGSMITFNNDPTLKFKVEASDSSYLLTWYLDPKFNTTKDKVWAVKHRPVNRRITGVKDMGYLTPIFPKHLDVIFISYNESNAEDNWKRVLEKAPWAKRINGVEGIFNAHKAASVLAKTDMFYVVDGDAWLSDEWNFNFQPGIFDRSFTHIWQASNPINGLKYGYGGVKLFSKHVMDTAKSWTTLDMATTVTPDIKIIDQVSNITAFNTDEFSTWRSAFRECAKLCYNIQLNPSDTETQDRLDKWKTINDQPFSQYAVDAANTAETWVDNNKDNIDILLNINDRNWLEQEFNKIYNDNRN